MNRSELDIIKKWYGKNSASLETNCKNAMEALLDEVQGLTEENIILENNLYAEKKEMRSYENMYRNLYNYIPIPYATIDCDGTILDINDAFSLFIGKQYGFIIEENIMDYMCDESRGKIKFFLDCQKKATSYQSKRDQKLEIDFMCKGKKRETILYYNHFVMNFTTVLRIAILDISEMNKARRMLKSEHDRYQIALQVFSDYIFEYNIIEDEMLCYGNPLNKKTPKTTEVKRSHFMHWLTTGNICKQKYIDDMQKFIDGEKNSVKIEVCSNLNGKENVYYFEVYGTRINEYNRDIKIIGRIHDITEMQEKENALLQASYCDELTGCYTASHGLYLMNDYMQTLSASEEICMIMFQLDNIGEINEQYSMIFGNNMIYSVAKLIRTKLLKSEIVIRISGNQFLVIVTHMTRNEAVSFSNCIIQESLQLYAGELTKLVLSACIVEDKPFKDWKNPNLIKIFQQMSRILKVQEKPSVSIVSVNELRSCFSDTPVNYNYAEFTGIGSIYCSTKKDFTTYAFDLLEQTKHTDSAVKLLLNGIGVKYSFDEIRIYETDSAYLTKYIKYRWKKFGSNIEIPKSIHYESRILYEKVFAFFRSFTMFESINGWEENCDIEVVDYLKKQYGKNHMLIDSLMLDGKTEGFIVFINEEYKEIPEDEKKALHGIVQMISLYLNKNHADSASRAKSDFLSKMSHEIRTPLNGVVGILQLIKHYVESEEITDREVLKEKICNSIDKAQISIEFLLSIINNVLDMAKIENGNIELNSKEFLISEVLENLQVITQRGILKKNIVLIVIPKYDTDRVAGDMLRFSQVLINLVENALKFSPENGNIILEIIQTGLENKTATYHISVKDNGCGIEYEAQEDIFKSFVQAKKGRSNVQGVGLGLSICYNIIDKMGGHLKVKSAPDEGAEFYFDVSFPVSDNSADETEDVVKGKKLDGKRILIAEDNELNMQIMEELLCIEGFLVEKAYDGREAVEQFLQHESGYYQTILMDIRMPNMDGLEAARQIRMTDRKDARKIPIVAVTSDAFDEDMEKGIACGMNGYLIKPVKMEELKKLLYELM